MRSLGAWENKSRRRVAWDLGFPSRTSANSSKWSRLTCELPSSYTSLLTPPSSPKTQLVKGQSRRDFYLRDLEALKRRGKHRPGSSPGSTNTAANRPWAGRWLTLVLASRSRFPPSIGAKHKYLDGVRRRPLQGLQLAPNVFKYGNVAGPSQGADGSLRVPRPLINGPAN